MPGTIILKPLEAKLQRNINAFTKMDPYYVAILGDLQIKGQVCKNGGLHPSWGDAVSLQVKEEASCFVEVKDKDLLGTDNTIGVCEIPVAQIIEEGSSSKWYELYLKKTSIGQILIEAVHTEQMYPSRLIVYSKPKPLPVQEEPVVQNPNPNANPLNKTKLILSRHIPSAQELTMNGEGNFD